MGLNWNKLEFNRGKNEELSEVIVWRIVSVELVNISLSTLRNELLNVQQEIKQKRQWKNLGTYGRSIVHYIVSRVTIDAYQKKLDEKLEMLKDHLVMLQQESQVNCTEDESSNRHIREEQESIYNVTKRRNWARSGERKLELRNKYKTSGNDEKAEQAKVKLPKLVITQFYANHLDWLRFWNELKNQKLKNQLCQQFQSTFI